MITLIAVLVLFAVPAAAGIVGGIVTAARDGYHRIRTDPLRLP